MHTPETLPTVLTYTAKKQRSNLARRLRDALMFSLGIPDGGEFVAFLTDLPVNGNRDALEKWVRLQLATSEFSGMTVPSQMLPILTRKLRAKLEVIQDEFA